MNEIKKSEILKDDSKWDKKTTAIYTKYLEEYEASILQLDKLIDIHTQYTFSDTKDINTLKKQAPSFLLCNRIFGAKLQCKLMKIVDPDLDLQKEFLTVKIIYLYVCFIYNPCTYQQITKQNGKYRKLHGNDSLYHHLNWIPSTTNNINIYKEEDEEEYKIKEYMRQHCSEYVFDPNYPDSYFLTFKSSYSYDELSNLTTTVLDSEKRIPFERPIKRFNKELNRETVWMTGDFQSQKICKCCYDYGGISVRPIYENELHYQLKKRVYQEIIKYNPKLEKIIPTLPNCCNINHYIRNTDKCGMHDDLDRKFQRKKNGNNKNNNNDENKTDDTQLSNQMVVIGFSIGRKARFTLASRQIFNRVSFNFYCIYYISTKTICHFYFYTVFLF